jgi:hypothetical protein
LSAASEKLTESVVIEYDVTVIQKHASSLYDRARVITISYGLLAFILAGLAGVVVTDSDSALGIAFFGALIGVAVGRAKSFELRLQAQTALCYAEIERHTRQTAIVVTESARVNVAPTSR